MLRDIYYGINKPVPAVYKANQAMKTGVAVVVDETTGKFDYPSSAVGENLYFVDKERVATGYKAGLVNLSDYDETYTTIEQDEFAKLKAYSYGDVFATDATGTPTAGSVVVFDNTGAIADATEGTTSVYEYVGTINDNGHTLKKIRVLAVPRANS